MEVINEKYISGIFNYCDRWCERCSLTHRCRLYTDDQKRLVEHRRKGEDPYDMKVVLNDVDENLKETMELLYKIAAERGIDLDNLPEEDYQAPEPSSHPLYKRSQNYMHVAHGFLKKLRESIEAVEVIPSVNDSVQNYEEIVSCYEIVSWYHTLISAKIYRALSSKMEKVYKEKDPQINLDDANGSAKVAYLVIEKSIVALQKIYKWNKWLQDDTLSLLVEADRLRKGINIEFPGHYNFKRPGFDEIIGGHESRSRL